MRLQCDLSDDHLQITRTAENKQPLLQRLNRIEGQVRGLSQMVENDRYWRDQSNRGARSWQQYERSRCCSLRSILKWRRAAGGRMLWRR
jgi:hypothetical protein